MPDPQAAPTIPDGARFTSISLHNHVAGVTSATCPICADVQPRHYAFQADSCVCDHEDWQHGMTGCAVGASEMTHCVCPAGWRHDPS